MEILNIGPLELIVIVVIMFVLLGPKEMILTAYRIGKFIRGVVRSPMWKEIIGYSQEIRELPQKLMEDTGLDDTLAEVKKSTQEAADEIKTQINEVTAAARVQEAEHVRLGAGDVTEATAPQTFVSSPEATPVNEPAATAPETTQAPAKSAGVSVGIPMTPVYNTIKPSPAAGSEPAGPLPDIQPALRPRRLRSAETADAVALSSAVSADGTAFASFAPRARRHQAAEAAVIAATGGEQPANGHNGANGSVNSAPDQPINMDVPARIVPPATETEPHDAAE